MNVIRGTNKNNFIMIHSQQDDFVSNCDSGSPLILPGTDTIIGMVSWGMDCADPDFPAVNSRISDSYEWIRGTTCDLSRYPPSYLCGTPNRDRAILYTLALALFLSYLWRRRCNRTAKQQYSLIADATGINV